MVENSREWLLEKRENSRFATRFRERSAIRARMREASRREKAVHRLERKQSIPSPGSLPSAKGSLKAIRNVGKLQRV